MIRDSFPRSRDADADFGLMEMRAEDCQRCRASMRGRRLNSKLMAGRILGLFAF